MILKIQLCHLRNNHIVKCIKIEKLFVIVFHSITVLPVFLIKNW